MTAPGTPLWDECVQRAEEDFRACLRLQSDVELFSNIIAFHAQQAAEKYLKALMVLNRQDVLRTHDLSTLAQLLQQAGIAVSAVQSELGRLNPFAVNIRYPGDDVTEDAARQALNDASTIRVLCRTLLGLDTARP